MGESHFEIPSVFPDFKQLLDEKLKNYKSNTLDTKQFQDQLRFSGAMTLDFIRAIQIISFYSTRNKDHFDQSLVIFSIDDFIQSTVAIGGLINEGIHNVVRRELRYLIETAIKYLVVDQELKSSKLSEKIDYLKNAVPNSSIEVIERLKTPFTMAEDKEFKSEVVDFFYKACAYTHPSKKQIEEQVQNYERGNTIGFESAASLSAINKIVFRCYDMLLFVFFHGFGSMSGDIFTHVLDENKSWKYHKGKYVGRYSALYDYKIERARGSVLNDGDV